MLPTLDCRNDPQWLIKACNLMRTLGMVAIEGVLDEEFVREARAAMYRAQAAVLQEVGKERLDRSDELGVIRLPLKYEPVLAHFLELPEALALIDNLLSPHAVLQFQTGLVLPPKSKDAATKGVFQTRFHMDFPRILNGYVMSINLMFAIDEYRVDNGATQFLLGSHQQRTPTSCACSAMTSSSLYPGGRKRCWVGMRACPPTSTSTTSRPPNDSTKAARANDMRQNLRFFRPPLTG